MAEQDGVSDWAREGTPWAPGRSFSRGVSVPGSALCRRGAKRALSFGDRGCPVLAADTVWHRLYTDSWCYVLESHPGLKLRWRSLRTPWKEPAKPVLPLASDLVGSVPLRGSFCLFVMLGLGMDHFLFV